MRTTKSSTTRSEPQRFGFGLGSNLGDSVALLVAALEALEQRFGRLEVAPLYRTEPVSTVAQPHFLNTVALGSTEESPETLLGFVLELERRLGRERGARDAPRTIDIDLLFVGNEVRADPRLTLPHPRLRGRRFVLAPLADLAPGLTLPPDGATVSTLLAALPLRPGVERLGTLEELAS